MTSAAQLFSQALPHLEAVLGSHIDNLLNFQEITPGHAVGLVRQCHPGLADQVRWQFPDLQGEDLASAIQTAGASLVRSTGVLHREGSKVIMVIPENLRAMAGWDTSLRRVNSAEFLQLALIREAVLYVLDSRYRLAELRRRCSDGDAQQALQAVIEGRALQVTEQVARRLGTSAYFPLLTQCYLHVPEPASDGNQRTVNYYTIRRMHWACIQGVAFFDYLKAQGIKDAEKLAFSTPPRQARWMDQPELYVRARIANLSDLGATLATFSSAVAAGNWKVEQEPWTPAMVRQVAELFGEKGRIDKVLAGWDEGRSLVWTSKNPPLDQIGLGVIRFANPAAARAYFGFAIDLQRKQDIKLGDGNTKSREVSLRGADQAVRSDGKRMVWVSAPSLPVTVLLIRSGPWVFEWTWYGLPPKIAWAERLLDQFFVGTPSARR
jgi:hypothetical protein